jgi:quinol monooxygenase YgiN
MRAGRYRLRSREDARPRSAWVRLPEVDQEGSAMYTSGVWIVKKGREDDFARRWQEAADSVSLDYPDVTFRLLRDHENPQRFISLADGWRGAEQIETAQSTPAYQDAMTSLWRLLESGEMSSLDLVAEIS